MSLSTPAPRTPAEEPLSPLTAAIAASPHFRALLNTRTISPLASSHPLLDALITFMSSPAGQALEAALIQMILSALTPKT